MKISEVCKLLLEASIMGNGRELFVFDLEKPVKIVDLSEKMIRLNGMIPNIDRSITFTGLRSREKLYEELLTDDENTIKTYHEKIMIAKVGTVNLESIEDCISSLILMVENQDDDSLLVARTKESLT